MSTTKEIGNMGEDIAVKYLKQQNYKILQRNFFSKKGEIDIIAKDCENSEIVFIEVKTRTNSKYGKPSEAIDKNKMKHIYQTAIYYIMVNRLEQEYIRIDAIEIYICNGQIKVHHIKNIE